MSMKPITYVTLAGVLIGLASLSVGCPGGGVVLFQDPNLEAAVRGALGRPFGLLTQEDVLELRILDARSLTIQSLSGLEFATNLTWLNLSLNYIAEISPLAGLVNLETLNLDCNEIFEVSALQGLLNLQWLSLCGNDIGEVGGLVTNALNNGLGPGDVVIVDCALEMSDPQGIDQLLVLGVDMLCCDQITCGN